MNGNGLVSYWEGKIWGRVMHVFASPHAAVSYLLVEPGTYCSKHLHRIRANVFVCITATLEIVEWSDEGVQSSKLIRPGSSYEVPSERIHQFRVVHGGEVIEIYYADREGEVDINDIVRFEEGGRISQRR